MVYALYCVPNFMMYIISLALSLYISYKCSMLRGKKYIASCWSHYIFVYFLQHLSHDLTNREVVTSKLCTAITKTLKHFFFLMVWCWVAETHIPQQASYNFQERLLVFQDSLQKYLFEN